MNDTLSALESLTSSELSDAMDSLGIESVLTGIKPLSGPNKLIGPVYTVKYQNYSQRPDSFRSASDYIDDVPRGSVIVIDNEGNETCSTWGHILSYTAELKGIKGTVIHGAFRDLEDIKAMRYPVYARAVTMRSGKNRVFKVAEQITLQIGSVNINPGDILFGDQSGVLIIPKKQEAEVIARALKIKQTEKKIVKAVCEGQSLAEARRQYRYDMPWL